MLFDSRTERHRRPAVFFWLGVVSLSTCFSVGLEEASFNDADDDDIVESTAGSEEELIAAVAEKLSNFASMLGEGMSEDVHLDAKVAFADSIDVNSVQDMLAKMRQATSDGSSDSIPSISVEEALEQMASSASSLAADSRHFFSIDDAAAKTSKADSIRASDSSSTSLIEDVMGDAAPSPPPAPMVPRVVTLAAPVFDDAIFGKADKFRTKAVLFHVGEGSAEVKSAMSEFVLAADKMCGVALFYTLSCVAWPVLCSAHGVPVGAPTGGRATSLAMLIYPPSPAGAEIYGGGFKSPDLVKAVARRVTTSASSKKLTSQTVQAFMKNELKPFKAIFFDVTAAGGAVEISHALAADPDLWYHVDFAYAMHGDAVRDTIASLFETEGEGLILHGKLKSNARYIYQIGAEIPGGRKATWDFDRVREFIWRVVRLGHQNNVSQAKFPPLQVADISPEPPKQIEIRVHHDSFKKPLTFVVAHDATFGTIKTSLAKRLKRDDVKEGYFVPLGGDEQNPIEDSASLDDSRDVVIAGVSFDSYETLERGKNGCPAGQEIRSVEECERALGFLGIKLMPKWVSVFDGLPRWCSVREKTSSTSKERMHFNSASTGVGRDDLAPVCKAKPSAKKSSSPKLQPPTSLLPELSGSNRLELFGSEGFSFIYLTEGTISAAEQEMVLKLKGRFQPQLTEQKTSMNWMWMDLRIERKLRALFDPPALPSAVILNPHKRPRFAGLRHAEEDDEASPASEEQLVLLMNTVLGGDAKFTQIGSSKLIWADRSGARSTKPT